LTYVDAEKENAKRKMGQKKADVNTQARGEIPTD